MPEESSVQAARELRVVVGRLRRRLRALPGSGALTPSQTSLLTRIGKEGPASASTLATAEGVRPQSVATLLGALDEHGLIDRQADPADGRRQVISLSAAGQRMFESDSRAREEWLARAFQERFTEAERQTVVAALGLLDRLASVE
jgi:DNA-binding MarR family transcriptional regulator